MGHKIVKGKDVYQPYLDEKTGKIEIFTYRVSSIRKDTVHLIEVNKWTWVCKNTYKQNEDAKYGWAENIDDWHRDRFSLSNGLPKRYFFTKKGAIGSMIPKVRSSIKKLQKRLERLIAMRDKEKEMEKIRKQMKKDKAKQKRERDKMIKKRLDEEFGKE